MRDEDGRKLARAVGSRGKLGLKTRRDPRDISHRGGPRKKKPGCKLCSRGQILGGESQLVREEILEMASKVATALAGTSRSERRRAWLKSHH
jgi:hypothetical protein